MPELASEGSTRKTFVKVHKLKIGKLEEDELNLGRYKISVEFELDKGCYATVFLSRLFSDISVN